MGRKKGSKNKPKPKKQDVYVERPLDPCYANSVLDYIQSRCDAWQRRYGTEDTAVTIDRAKLNLESLKVEIKEPARG